jgi:two-component system sensor kinase FixL
MFGNDQTQRTFVVSMIFLAMTIAEAGVIVWLLMLRARRGRIAPGPGGFGQKEACAQTPSRLTPGIDSPRFSTGPHAKLVDLFATLTPHGRLASARVGSSAFKAGETLRQTRTASAGARAQHPLAGPRRMATLRAFRWAVPAHQRVFANAQAAQPCPSRDASVDEFRALWESLPLAVILLSGDGEVLAANARAQQVFGYAAGDLAGKPVTTLVPALQGKYGRPDDDGSNATCDDLYFASTRSLVAKRKNGLEFPVEIVFRPSSRHVDATVLAFVEDRTDHFELLRNQQELAHLMRVYTMGELAGSLAHELNQPLTAILSNVQAAQRFMAADPIDVTEVREILKDIVQDDYRASEVIRRIRATVKKGEMEFALLDLATVIREVVFLLHSDAIMRETRVVLKPCNDLLPVYADRVQLQQVVLNLLLNAFDAMSSVLPEQRVVSIELSAQAGDTARIAVRDCGLGLTVGKLDAVFRPFYTSKPHGLGLGLSISRSIVELHGGRIWAENNIERGATFFVTLPTGRAAGDRKSRYGP